jgi:hypothetical protein
VTVEIPYAYIIGAIGLAGCFAVGAVIGILVTLVRG